MLMNSKENIKTIVVKSNSIVFHGISYFIHTKIKFKSLLDHEINFELYAWNL